MLNGVPRYHTVKSTEPRITLMGCDRTTANWQPLVNFVSEELVWNNRRLRVGSLAETLSHIRIVFSTTVKKSNFGDSKPKAKGYSSHNPSGALELVLAITDVAKGERRCIRAAFSPSPIESEEYVSSVDLELELADLGPIVTVRPLLVLSIQRAVDRSSGLTVKKGTILQEYEPFRVTSEQHQGGLTSVFEFRFVSFSELFPDLVSAIHRHRLDEDAILYINTDIEGIRRVLQNEGSNSDATDVMKRDNLNCRIAEQVLGVELARLAGKLRSEFLDDEAAVDYCLTAPERSLVESWLHVLDPSVLASRRQSIGQAFREMVVGLSTMSERDFHEFASQDLPSRIQHEIDSRSSTYRFLKQEEPEPSV